MEIEQEDGTYVVHNEMGEEDLTVTISLALSELDDVPPAEIIPQFPEHVDPDALNRLFKPFPNGELRQGGPLYLSIEGYSIAIFSSGRIEIEQ